MKAGLLLLLFVLALAAASITVLCEPRVTLESPGSASGSWWLCLSNDTSSATLTARAYGKVSFRSTERGTKVRVKVVISSATDGFDTVMVTAKVVTDREVRLEEIGHSFSWAEADTKTNTVHNDGDACSPDGVAKLEASVSIAVVEGGITGLEVYAEARVKSPTGLWTTASSCPCSGGDDGGGGGGGGGQPTQHTWTLKVYSDPQGMPFTLNGKTRATPWEKEYEWEGEKSWSISYEALGNDTYRPYMVEVRVRTSPWYTSCSPTERVWNFTSTSIKLRVEASGNGKASYTLVVEGGGVTRKRSGYCSLEVVVVAHYSRPSTLTVRTNVDDYVDEPAVLVNGSPVPTPYVLIVPGELTASLEARNRVLGKIDVDVGLPSYMEVRCELEYCEKRWVSVDLNDTYAVEFTAYLNRGTVSVYKIRKVEGGWERKLLWSKSSQNRYKEHVTIGPTDLRGWKLEFQLSGGEAVVKKLRVYKTRRLLFAKWIVYDEHGNAVLDPPTNISVTVPMGRNWTAVAYYNYTPTILVVDSVPEGVEVLINDSTRQTPLTINSSSSIATYLAAPSPWSGYEFRNWTLYDSQGQILWSSTSPSVSVVVPSGEFYRAIVYYSEESTSYETIRLQGSVYHLPYQWVSLPMNLTPGLWILNSSPAEPNPSTRTLIYATLQAPSGDYMLVPAVNLLVNVTETERLPVLRCSSGECRPILSIECLNYSGYYLVGLGVMNWTRPGSSAAELSSLLLPNGTTLAIYNVTLLNASGGTVYWKPVIVTSLNVELDAIYEEKGVNLVWNVSYSHLAPDWLHAALNVTEALKPYQSLYLRLYWEGKVLWEQRLGVVPEGLDLSENSRSSYAGVYVSYDELVDLFGFESPVLTARATWTAMGIPLAENASVRFVPAGIELRSLTQGPSAWIWEVAPTTVVGNVPGNYLCYRGVLVYYFNGTRHTLSPVLGASFDLYRFSTPPFVVGRGTLVAYYVPPTTKNVVYFFYPFEF